MPSASRLARDRTECLGRLAGRESISVRMGSTDKSTSPATRSKWHANSCQLHEPELLAWTVPCASNLQSWTIARARSRLYVGQPIWSSTTDNFLPASAALRIVLGKHRPFAPKSQEVLTMHAHGNISRTNFSPSAFDRPYALIGFISSLVSYEVGLAPSNT